MIFLLFKLQDLPTEEVANAFLKEGVMGAFIVLLLIFIVFMGIALNRVYKGKDSAESYNREVVGLMTETSNSLTNVIKDVYKDTQALPDDIKEKLDPKLDIIIEQGKEIKRRLP